MSKKWQEEQLALLVSLIKRGRINEAEQMLEADKTKKLAKYSDDVRLICTLLCL